jgi:hypothetical protein
MTSLTVVSGMPKVEPNYFAIYLRGFIKQLHSDIKKLDNKEELTSDDYSRLVFYGINMLNTDKNESLEFGDLKKKFFQHQTIHSVISNLTPREFEGIFPIAKDYKGDRYGTKDYFSTRKMIDEIGRDNPIGENVEKFLFDYHNWEITHFIVDEMSVLSSLNRVKGRKGLMEQFTDETYLDSISTESPIKKKRSKLLKRIK